MGFVKLSISRQRPNVTNMICTRFAYTLIGVVVLFGLYAPRLSYALSKVVITTSSLTEREAALHVAQDRGFFKKRGVDAVLVQVRSGPLAIAALSSGESHLHWGSVTSANLGAIAAGADLAFVAGFINRLSGTFVVHPRLSTPADLRGKTIGVNTLSGGGGVFTLLALEYWNLLVERDKIHFRSLGDQSVIAQALGNGSIDAAYFGYSYGAMMVGKGFRLLADFDKLPIPYQGSGVIARRHFVNTQPVAVESVLRALVEAVEFIREPANKSAVLNSMLKGARLGSRAEAEEGYHRVTKLYAHKLAPTLDGIGNAIRVLGQQHERIRDLKAEELILDSIARKIDRERNPG